jgi:flagellar export protein FliJ
MADLSALIRLHKYELDEKRRGLTILYTQMGELERARQKLEAEFAIETAGVDMAAETSFTYAGYAERVTRERERIEEAERQLDIRIQTAKDSLMETFSELKKYEMTQAERERLEAEEQAFKESTMLDEIGLEGYRRRQSEGDA